ncbi:MAG: LysE family translocator [Marivibrio sp.]|uniref:LysE family translocator n=1 Tax=Marivibrio sp. TaxID=2039719 RepID=UPI0032ED8FC9
MPLDPDRFFAFVLASAALILMPGPVVMLVVATSLRHGARAGLQAVAGASAGAAVLIVCGTVGITTILALLQDLSFVVRYLGAAYLIWLGIREWRARDAGHACEATPAPRAASVMGQAFLVGVTNPKAILFYLAFFPQFLDPALPAGPQLALMAATFMGLAVLFDGGYALLAGRARRHMIDPALARLRRRVTGTLLIATGLALALTRK